VTFAAPCHGIGGLQDIMRDTVVGLAARGHSVTVLTTRHPEGILSETIGGVDWRYLPFDASRRHLPGRNPAWLAATVDAFEALCSTGGCDIVHSESTSGRLVARAARRHKIPTIVRYHGNYAGFMRATARRMKETRSLSVLAREARAAAEATVSFAANAADLSALRRCRSVVVSAQQLEDTARSQRLARRLIEVVPNGIDSVVFAPTSREATRAALRLPAGLTWVSVGRLTADKGFDCAIEALAASRTGPAADARLLIVGDGPERTRLRELARRLGVEERVELVGTQPPDEIPQWLNAADAFLFPTRRDEAGPLVVVQAMSCGLPAIASRAGSVPEVINQPGVNGLLVAPGDPEELRRAIEHVAANPAEARRIGSAGRERVLERYTLDAMLDGLLTVYRIALGEE
jgi:glycosyltransferase involved in cell wall biosynthesis